ncbi:MAG TPA: hypothetical protein RMH85_23225 [Polyangiaceae bacterium LLY-WYZ-15_(1-7)]|nr:hypothetical protein [Myxococcales bacterium]MAT26810.1 hypothetical protein [Sandaracinus sp.]HJK95212.1 hypothetical protein [Polyangiaceae bacterium LLY-WYZ-15_(1-7)]MBJ74489.1 hypothetical protein [Sandaracinus sp.]HJK99881.1 hypothetical protein [Polyangiaceae bacterium LLY-WYZ-15_(1-7)]
MRRLLPLLALALLATPASADVVQSPPDDCPSGAIGRTNHYGPHCAPDVCDPAAEEACTTGSYPPRPAGRACREAAFCVTTRTVEHWRGNTTIRRFIGPCGADGSCAEGECERAHYCVDPDATGQATGASESEMTGGAEASAMEGATESAGAAAEPSAAAGATEMGGATASAMEGASDDEDGDDEGSGDEGGCAAGGRSAGGAVLLAGLLFVARRRR